MIIGYLVAASKVEAKKIGKLLVHNRLAACVNLWPIESIYHWEEDLVEDEEVVVIIKTEKKQIKTIEKLVNKVHSYDVPVLFFWNSEHELAAYRKWAKKEIK
ncbi:MAG: divalent cation tolerance protein CutA [bacterium]